MINFLRENIYTNYQYFWEQSLTFLTHSHPLIFENENLEKILIKKHLFGELIQQQNNLKPDTSFPSISSSPKQTSPISL